MISKHFETIEPGKTWNIVRRRNPPFALLARHSLVDLHRSQGLSPRHAWLDSAFEHKHVSKCFKCVQISWHKMKQFISETHTKSMFHVCRWSKRSWLSTSCLSRRRGSWRTPALEPSHPCSADTSQPCHPSKQWWHSLEASRSWLYQFLLLNDCCICCCVMAPTPTILLSKLRMGGRQEGSFPSSQFYQIRTIVVKLRWQSLSK